MSYSSVIAPDLGNHYQFRLLKNPSDLLFYVMFFCLELRKGFSSSEKILIRIFIWFRFAKVVCNFFFFKLKERNL